MKKRVFQIVCFMLVFSLMFCFSSRLLKRKYSDNEYRLFYEKCKDYDVLFYGPSVVHYAISPMQLWNDYGITSYNMGNDSERLAMTYYDILNSLDYAEPKLIVVDLTSMGWAGSMRDHTLKDHNFLDAVPLSLNKMKEVTTIFEKEEVLEYLFPFALYHSRWNELSAEDFNFNFHNVMYGVRFQTGIQETSKPTHEMYQESLYGNVDAEAINIQKMIDLCNEHNIQIVFIYLPGGMRGGDQKLREFCANYLSAQGVAYYYMLNVDFIDWHRDFIDGIHVNYFGAEKITNYLGEILSNEYNIADHRDNQHYVGSWNKDYLDYDVMIKAYLEDNLGMYNAVKSE